MNRAVDRPYWQLEVDDDRVAWLRFDCPGTVTNTLSRAALEALDSRIGEIGSLAPRAVVVASAKASGFIAGADIREFTQLKTADAAYELVRTGQKVLARLATLPCPTVAAINGFALGGGLELAMACRYRVACDDAQVKLGLPEVLLGIHPGFGGTVRAVHLLGPVRAMDLMLTGRNLSASRALEYGLVDRLAPPGELEAAARSLALESPPPRRLPLRMRIANLWFARPLLAAQMTRKAGQRVRREHYPAPYALIDLWRRHGADPATGYEAEAQSIARLFSTPTARNLVRVFFLQDRLKALGGKRSGEFDRVHVIGAGVMGGDIASWCAQQGLATTLEDREMKYITPALERAREAFARRYSDETERGRVAARLVADVEGTGARRADVVIEAIFESAEAKQALYAKVEPLMKPAAILATNTSSLMLEKLADGLADPGRLVGLHFFNPVARMPLVEVVHDDATHPDVLARALAFARRIDKLPLPCRSAPGFVVNRILMPYMAEAMYAAQQGVPLATIDRVATDFGMPVGPVELADTVGLDVAMHVGRILAEAFGRAAPQGLGELVSAGKLGRKSGAGFYVWRDGKPVKPSAGDSRAPTDLEERLVLAMLNEAVAVLREGIVDDADLLDAGVIFGTGFAPFRGGPIEYARSRGISEVVTALEGLARKYGDRFAPDPGWRTLGSQG
jgi:3-hydroxyacyl-CoA dehydrogenase / enoyl-CoA hydratase / 3-hydroxybutyryl-CoA epimerase